MTEPSGPSDPTEPFEPRDPRGGAEGPDATGWMDILRSRAGRFRSGGEDGTVGADAGTGATDTRIQPPALGEVAQMGRPRVHRTLVLDDASTSGAGGASAVQTVSRIVRDALEARASDIHLEDYADGLRVRYRIDGILRDAEPPRTKLRGAVLARLRVMADMNLAEHRLPQDGRMRVRHGEREIDIRVSSVPMLGGESMALRLLDPSRERLALEDLGLLEDDLVALEAIIALPHGMILATGPGGSGKSTTLHAILRRLSTGREKIITVEDPVEFDVPGICQVPVNRKAGLTFPTLLRSLVRQDPDILLVGEIRDGETAEIATNAALTGHLVLSTLHTTDSVSALHRMHDLGVADYLAAHTIEAVMAQRLVRKVCDACAEEHPLPRPEALALGPAAEGLTTVSRGGGCDACRGSGFRERIGLYELLVVTDPLREAFLGRLSTRELRATARAEGLRTLREDGVAKIRRGITTPEEVLRVS